MPIYGLYLGTKYEVCRWNIIRDMTSCLVFYPFLGKFDLDLWPWKFDLDGKSEGQGEIGHRDLGHWMCLNGLYLGTTYQVCRWNILRDMTSSLWFFFLCSLFFWFFFFLCFFLPITLSGFYQVWYICFFTLIWENWPLIGTKYEVCQGNSIRDIASC